MKKKILIVTTVSDSIPFFKGQIDVLKEGFDVRLLSSPGKHLDEMSDLHQVPKYTVEMKREISVANDIISLTKLILLFIKLKPFILHGNTPKAGLLSMLAAWITFVPKRIYYVHGLRYEGNRGVKRKVLMIMERITCKLATHVIAVSRGVQEVMKQDNIYRKQIYLIGNGSINGIDIDYFNPETVQNTVRETYGISNDDFVFGFVGRLVGDKGINELVKSFTIISQQYKNTRLLLLGSMESTLDPLQESTVEAIKSNPHIIQVDFQRDVRPFLKAMDVFVFPSYREGFGIVLIEAGAMNIPVIATNITGCNEVIEDNINGFLIPPKDEVSLTKKMLFCLQTPEEMRKAAAIARSSVVQRFEQKELWRQSLELYKNIAGA